jgi:hypothetical protein
MKQIKRTRVPGQQEENFMIENTSTPHQELDKAGSSQLRILGI